MMDNGLVGWLFLTMVISLKMVSSLFEKERKKKETTQKYVKIKVR